MNFLKPLPFIILASLLFSCKKKEEAPKSVPVEFTSTTYAGLGSYDTSGKPSYLVLPRDVVTANMMTYISTTLPDRTDLRTTHPELLTTQAIADIKITDSSDVFITYVSQGGGFTNTFAFYTYPTGKSPASTKDIPKITYIFPNSGNKTTLVRGDKVKIGRFGLGTSIGFVLLQKGWEDVSNTIDNKVVHFCSNDVLNPEVDPALKKHAVLINYAPENKVLIGFEDVDRTLPACDHDFNDVVFYATVKP
ncbi:MAG: DUF4114 domain-containing protein [Ferruginibacter sp.]|nr:DUF4114 domain-containing protein [Ferruginibacter sp.]